jgi:transposase InsO family protein
MSSINFPFLANIKTISPRPNLFVIGEHAHSRYLSDNAYQRTRWRSEGTVYRSEHRTEHRTHRPLLQDRIAKSHSRPYVSHDNPYSEAQFKPLNCQPGFPSRFGSLADARAHYAGFFTWYNQQHRHSCIGMTTPESVHTAVPPRSASCARQRWKHLQTHAKPL